MEASDRTPTRGSLLPATIFPAAELEPAQTPQLVPPLPAIDALG
jgi:hypothetical protein